MEDEKEDEDIMQGILVKVGLILKEKRNLHILISHSLCYKEVGAIFVPSNSSSYQTVSCRTSGCLALTESQRSCDSKNMCHYKMGYEDRTHTTGDLAVDAFWFGTTFQYVVFGCGHDNIGHFDKECSGIIGLGVRIICTGPNVVSTPLVKKDPSTFYYLTLESVLVGQNNVLSNKSFLKKDVQEGNIFINSGTTLTFIDRDLYEELTSGLTEVLGSPTAQDPHGFLEFCYDELNMDTVPTVTFRFTGADVKLPPVNTFMLMQNGMSCLTIVASTDIAIFGNLSQRNLLVGYDLVNNKVSF
ncbi:aspartic proteinase CDR1-like protein [Tanacetum coccineum]